MSTPLDTCTSSAILWRQQKTPAEHKHELMCGFLARSGIHDTCEGYWAAVERIYAEGVTRGIYPKEGVSDAV